MIALMSNAIVRHMSIKAEDVNFFLRHPAMRAQIKMLMGLPVIMRTALGALYTLLQNFPSTDKEIRFALMSPSESHSIACSSA